MVFLVLPKSGRSWLSVVAACAMSFLSLSSLNRSWTADNISEVDYLRNLRQLSAVPHFQEPVKILSKNSKLVGDLAPFIEPVEINPDSSISSDILGIWNNQKLGAVCVRLKAHSRCPHPSLIGRLYGKSIVMLEWSQVAPAGSRFTEYCGSYANRWLDPGSYFLEILIIHCNGFGTTALAKSRSERNHNGRRVAKWLSFDYTYECIEDATRNRLTGNNAFLSISSYSVGSGDHQRGHWVLSDESKLNSVGFPNQQFTRYQPQGCRPQDPDLLLDRCQVPMDNSRIYEYSFMWNQNQKWMEQLKKFQVDFGPKFKRDSFLKSSHDFHAAVKKYRDESDGPPICLMGCSHSYFIWRSMFRLNLGHRFVESMLLYPEPDEALFRMKLSYARYNCTTFIIAAGQWPSSKQAWDNEKYGKPFSFQKFYKGLSAIVQNPKIFDIDPNINIYLRTIHLNPLGDLISDCGVEQRPKDWRSPTVIDGYNLLVKEIVEGVKATSPKLRDRVHLLDTRFITDPMWDTALDFNHLHSRVGDVEALYIAGKLLLKGDTMSSD
eukprot:CCRYP_020214-RA/>CCRYP_020214-RA protein AED:0.07 eAED:0.07 QI:10/1/1/1/1/1/3/306/548